MRPEQFAPRSPAPGRRCRLATRPIRPSSPHTGTTHCRRLRCGGRGGLGGTGRAVGCAALGSALLPVAGRPPAEPLRSRGGGAASQGAGWRRAPWPGTGLRAPPAGSPSGQPRDGGPEPGCQVRAVTSRVLARPSRLPYPLCPSRAVWPCASQLTSPSLVWKLIQMD